MIEVPPRLSEIFNPALALPSPGVLQDIGRADSLHACEVLDGSSDGVDAFDAVRLVVPWVVNRIGRNAVRFDWMDHRFPPGILAGIG